MLSQQFFGQNLHFVISFFAALVCFAVFWLYFDAWTNKHEPKELFKWAGFFLLSVSFLVHATLIEQASFGDSLFGAVADPLSIILRLVGYFSISLGLLIDPLQKAPKVTGLAAPEPPAPPKPDVSKEPEPKKPHPHRTHSPKKKKIKVLPSFFPAFLPGVGTFKASLPAGALIVSLLYFRRATTGLERHLKPIALAFLLLGVYELAGLATLLRDSDNPLIYSQVAPFSWLWLSEHLLLLIGVMIMGLWVWQYLTKRIQSQLFMIFTTITMAVFIITTVSFTFLLMGNLQREALGNLETAASTLNYALDAKKAETKASAEIIAQNPAIASAVTARDHARLAALTTGFLQSKKQSSLVIITDSAQVLLRGEDPSRWGDSLSGDSLIRRALVGTAVSSVTSKESVLAPLVYITSASPIRDDSQQIIGAAVVSLVADNAFVDGIKQATGLDSAIYSGNIRSATTLVAPDGKSRWVGVKDEHKQVGADVLQKGGSFKGPLSISNKSYLGVYVPIKDADNTVVGMLFLGQPQSTLLKTAGHSIELTFVIAASLLVLAVIPSYYISRYLAYQVS
ncbi:MAG: cache domain-containing protein [Patescibacteria group bacterium]